MLHLREIHYMGLTKSIIPYGANKQMNKETNKKLQTKQKIFWKIDKFLVNIFYIADFTKSIFKM